MNSETREGKEERVRNPEMETVVRHLGPNLFMYAESFWWETILYLSCWIGIIHYRGSVSTG